MKNPYNTETEPASHKWWEETQSLQKSNDMLTKKLFQDDDKTLGQELDALFGPLNRSGVVKCDAYLNIEDWNNVRQKVVLSIFPESKNDVAVNEFTVRYGDTNITFKQL